MAEKMTAKPSAKIIMFNALAPIIIKLNAASLRDSGRFRASSLNVFLGFNWNNSQFSLNF